MTLLEKINNSASSTLFTLYKEGLFYKCYNQDAMVFAKLVKPYKVITKYIKSADAKVTSLGFPVSEVEKGKLTLEFLSEKLSAHKYDVLNDKVTFHLAEDIKQDFESWRNSIVSEKGEEYNPKPESNKSFAGEANYLEIISRIKHFDLANSTPMEGLNFIQQLKKSEPLIKLIK